MDNDLMSADAPRAEGLAPAPPWLRGVVPPVCTPLDSDGEVDTASLERHIGFLLGAGVNGLFMLGSTSEAAYLTDRQRDRVLEVAVKTCGGQVPVLAGCVDMTTNRVTDHALRAKDRGVDAVVVTAPFFARAAHPAEVIAHFEAVRRRAELPLIAYDIPVSVHNKLELAVVVSLASGGVIDALKDSSNDIHGFRAVVTETRDLGRFAVFTGSELIVDCALFLGASGAVPGLANVDPHGYVTLYQSCQAGEWEKARHQQERLVRLFRVAACGNPAKKGANSSGLGGFKTALMLRGIIAENAVALPLVRLDEDEVAAVRLVLEQEGLM